MKTELEHLKEMVVIAGDPWMTSQLIIDKLKDRIKDIKRGYSDEDIKEIKMVERIQEGMQTIDDSHMVKQLIS